MMTQANGFLCYKETQTKSLGYKGLGLTQFFHEIYGLHTAGEVANFALKKRFA